MGLIDKVNVEVNGSGDLLSTLSTYTTKILKPNIIDGKNILTQAMISSRNTKYVIKYDYELEEDIAVPANCVLEFDGGSISGAFTVTGQNTGINAGLIKIFSTDITLAGTWNVAEAYPEWFGAKADISSDIAITNTIAIQKVIDNFSNVLFANTDKTLYYYVTNISNASSEVISINRNVILKGINKDVTKLKYIGTLDIPVVHLAGRSGRDSIMTDFTIEGNNEDSKIGIGVKIDYTTRKETFRNIEVLYMNKGFVSETWRVLFEQCAVYSCNKGFELGTNTPVTMYTLVGCGVNGCQVGYELKTLVYSSLVNCGADDCDLAYSLNGCSTMSFVSCGAENSRRLFLFTECNIIDILNIYDYLLTNDNLTKEDINNHIKLNNSYSIEIKNLNYKIQIPSNISEGYTDNDFYFVKIDNSKSNPGLILKGWKDNLGYSIAYYNRIAVDANGGMYYNKNRVVLVLDRQFNSISDVPVFTSAVHAGLNIQINDLSSSVMWNGSAWVTDGGFSAAPHKGKTIDRPQGEGNGGPLNRSRDIGFAYYDTDLFKLLFVKSINVAQTNVVWVDSTGATV